MSYLTYTAFVSHPGKPLAWLHGEIKTPPFSASARLESGVLLRRLQMSEILTMPQSRPLGVLGPRCHELRIRDAGRLWRIIYRTDPDAILILEVFAKKTPALPQSIIDLCIKRQKSYDRD